MSKPVKKLYNMEIDEISLVDRAANQHSLVSFAKNDSVGSDMEGVMPEEELFFEDGTPVDPEALEHGDIVSDVEGNEYVFVEDDVEVGKSARDEFVRHAGALKGGYRHGRDLSRERAALKRGGDKATLSEHEALIRARQKAMWDKEVGGVAGGVGMHVGRNRNAYLAGAGTVGAAGAAYGGKKAKDRFGKSYDIREELSKALTDADRDDMISKALEDAAYEAEIAKAEAAEARAQAEYERDLRITDEFISKAAEYNLPVAPELFGPILKSLAETLDPESLDVLDQIFTATGDALYDEIGYVGESSNTSVLDYVDAAANELVGKADVSRETAMTAMFEANPEAYDAYINELNGRY